MRTSQKTAILISLGLLLLNTGAHAADALYRFTHNDHDALVIGEIIRADEDGVVVRVEKNIISTKNLNEAYPRKQLNPDEVRVISPFCYTGYYSGDDGCTADPSVGDYVLLSLNKTLKGFEIAWGAYLVDSLDYKTLSVVLPEGAGDSIRMTAAAVKTFVNSDGRITDFTFDYDTRTVYAGEEKRVIFSGDDGESINSALNPAEDADEGREKSPYGSAGGVIGKGIFFGPLPASINSVKVLVVFTVLVLTIGYFMRSKGL